jgi:hypothetical protein
VHVPEVGDRVPKAISSAIAGPVLPAISAANASAPTKGDNFVLSMAEPPLNVLAKIGAHGKRANIGPTLATVCSQ